MSSKSLSINSDEYNQTSFSSNITSKEDEVRSRFSDTFLFSQKNPFIVHI